MKILVVGSGAREHALASRLAAEPGSEVTFNRVLLIEREDGQIVAGTPYVSGVSVTGVVESQDRGKKIRVFKMKRRKHYRRTKGHRTLQTRVRVTTINL